MTLVNEYKLELETQVSENVHEKQVTYFRGASPEPRQGGRISGNQSTTEDRMYQSSSQNHRPHMWSPQ